MKKIYFYKLLKEKNLSFENIIKIMDLEHFFVKEEDTLQVKTLFVKFQNLIERYKEKINKDYSYIKFYYDDKDKLDIDVSIALIDDYEGFHDILFFDEFVNEYKFDKRIPIDKAFKEIEEFIKKYNKTARRRELMKD